MKKIRKGSAEGIEVHHLPIAKENAFDFAKRTLQFLIICVEEFRLCLKKFRTLLFAMHFHSTPHVGLTPDAVKRRVESA